ncbi:cell surface protein [Philodulcilactobacillus myokoensis]|uniref:Cell surface protein n=1 Tax=Philodulcilactobacillus myokoensis TaxID=2929573 RepID=A0A9W6B1Q1_9LACO|nr:hypothetical protein [Philodulcilactobacillus myokoensis]GLB47247.1 cell surface protein [Philodulcilactobacillus myokoensis]
MKKALISIAIVAIFCLCGGFIIHQHNQNQRAYYNAIENGQVQISNHNYTLAETAFQNVSKEGQNNHNALTLLRQTQAYVAAKDAFEKHDFTRAKNGYQRASNIIGGSDLLYQYSNHKLREISTIQDNEDRFLGIYQQAADDSHDHKLRESQSIVNQLLNDSTLKESYYTKIRNQVKRLKKFNDQMLSGKLNQSTNSSFNDKLLDDHLSGNQNKSKSSNKNSRTSDEINKDQVLDARKLIQKAGVEAGSLSDQDVRVIIRQAAQHHKSIYSYVKAHPKSFQ